MKIRRVVTEKDKEGRSRVKWNDELEMIQGRSGLEKALIWATKDLPVKLSNEDPAKWEIGTSITNGSVFRVTKYEPGVAKRGHTTDSIDYAIVLSGEIWLQLDKEEVHLKTGDVVVQRSTNHNWVNRGEQPCIMVYVITSLEGGKSSTTAG
mgnify:CR=1 FL=1